MFGLFTGSRCDFHGQTFGTNRCLRPTLSRHHQKLCSWASYSLKNLARCTQSLTSCLCGTWAIGWDNFWCSVLETTFCRFAPGPCGPTFIWIDYCFLNLWLSKALNRGQKSIIKFRLSNFAGILEYIFSRSLLILSLIRRKFSFLWNIVIFAQFWQNSSFF